MSRPSLMIPLAALFASGCTVGPDYHPPSEAAPPAFAEAVPANARADVVDLEHWWTVFGDPELDRLVDAALNDAPDIRLVASRVRQARIAAGIARARYLPQINASGGVNRIDFSKNAGFSSLASLFGGGGSGSSGQGIATPGNGITTYSAGFDASWEIDLFGGGRRAVEGAKARVDAAEWTARDAAVSLSGEVANGYFQFRTLQRRESVLREDIARQERQLELRQHRAQAGLTPGDEPIREQASLSQLRASLEPLLIEQRIEMHALAVLIGRAPGALIDELSAPAPAVAVPPAIPPGLPSELLQRRPDVRAAERQLAAATADIGVATADLYPHISLTGVAELLSSGLSNLVSRDSVQTSAGARLAFPLLDFGRRRGEVDNRREAMTQAYIAYQKVVLGAFRDVEDALVRVDGAQKQTAQLAAGVADSKRALDVADARYQSGLTDLSAVLQARGGWIAQRQALVVAQGSLDQALASLYKALGGGWQQQAAQ
ncbi:MAG: Fis family transcriptional regulator [Sphingomonas sp. 28-66-16]|nr:MAG: Fis family transcriptional regulator [Sphingomonas sp. 28-66-16]